MAIIILTWGTFSGIISATATNATGCLTFEFYSNSSVTNTGWVAEISCVHPLAKTYVPDDNFEAYLESSGIGDGIANNDSVLTANISGVTNLYLTAVGIADLTGIQDFSALDTLYCSLNFQKHGKGSHHFSLLILVAIICQDLFPLSNSIVYQAALLQN